MRETISPVPGPFPQALWACEKGSFFFNAPCPEVLFEESNSTDLNRELPCAPELKAAQSGALGMIDYFFHMLLRIPPDVMDSAPSYYFASQMGIHVAKKIVNFLLVDHLLWLPLMIFGYFISLLLIVVLEGTETEVRRLKILTFVGNQRKIVVKKICAPGFQWKVTFIYYLLWWHHAGVMAGNVVVPRMQERNVAATSDTHDVMEVFRHEQGKTHHLFELWMHKPTWTNEFVAYKRLMSVHMGRPHLKQIASIWKDDGDWSSFDFVKIRIPSALEAFPQFMGARYIAYPTSDPERIPLLVHFNGLSRVMTGTVWIKSLQGGFSTAELFDILEPNNQCGERHLCSVEINNVILWPSIVWIEPGTFLLARQIDLDDSSDSRTTASTSACVSTDLSGQEKASDYDTDFEDFENPSFRHQYQQFEEQEDFMALTQTRCAQGIFPHRMREKSQELHGRMEMTRQQEYDQWNQDRDFMDQNARIFGQDDITTEIDGVALHDNGNVRFFLMGIHRLYLGTKEILVNIYEMGDFLDLLVIIRRAWGAHIPISNLALHYVNQQPPTEAMQGRDGVTLLCDFLPDPQNVPVALLTIVDTPDAPGSMDLTAHRARLLATCSYLQEITGLVMLCQNNAICTCDRGGHLFNGDLPILLFGGHRVNINIRLHADHCVSQGSGAEQGQVLPHYAPRITNEEETQEQHSLMQLPLARDQAYFWLYGYPLHGQDAIRVWEGAKGDMSNERFLAGQYCVSRHHLLPPQVLVHQAEPQPEDMRATNSLAFVLAAVEEVRAWQVLILVDLVWLHETPEATGSATQPSTAWRAPKVLDFHLDLRTFYEQLGLSIFCLSDPTSCTTMIKGQPWERLDQMMRIQSGNFARVQIRSAANDIPLATQWSMAQEGCSFSVMRARLAPPSSSTSTTTPGAENATYTFDEEEVIDLDTERVELMQRSLQEQSVFVYLENEVEPIAESLLDQEIFAPVQALQRRYARRVPWIRPEVLLFFKIKPQPVDLMAMRTWGYLHTIASQIPDGKAFTMVDVEFFENQRPMWRARPSPVTEWREVRYVTTPQNRFEFLKEVGLQSFCYGSGKVCFLSHRGQMWPLQDRAPREIQDGDYLLVQIKALPNAMTIQQQYRAANGQCIEGSRPPYQQALIDYQEHHDYDDSEYSHQITDNVSFLQVWRPSVARKGHDQVPPPGNGVKRVTFNQEVEGNDGEMMVDLALENRFIQHFCESRQDEQTRDRDKEFLHLMRFQKNEVKSENGEIPVSWTFLDHDLGDECDEKQKLRSLPLQLLRMPSDFAPWENDEWEEHGRLLNPGDEPKGQDLLPIAYEDPQDQPVVLPLDELIKHYEKPTLKLDRLIPQSSQVPELHSTAVKTNPRLDGSGDVHVHDVKIDCSGLNDLADVILEPWDFELRRDIPYGDFLKPGVFENITWPRPWQNDFEQIRIYTDGSYIWSAHDEKKVAAWSFSVIGLDHDGYEWMIGFHARRLHVENQSPSYLGSLVEDSDHAETEAIIWAILWGMQSSFAKKGIPFVIVSDAKTKVHGFQGSWKMKKGEIAKVAQAVTVAFQQITQCEFEWTRGHQGNTYNEIADHMAKMAALFPSEVCMPENDKLCFAEPQPLENEVLMKQDNVVSMTKATMKLEILSYNVNTLGENKHRGKMEMIMQQIRGLEANVIGLQETRRRQCKQFVQGPFLTFSSAALKGQGGVDLCFRTDKPFLDEKGVKRYFAANAFTVVKACSRALMIRYKCAGLTVLFLAMHAPHESSPLDEKKDFWTMVEDMMKPYRDIPCCVMMDANARVGSRDRMGIGSAFSQEENINGGFLAKFVHDAHLFLPATFDKYILNPQEDQGTWYHKTGTARLNYIALPLSWANGTISTDVTDCEKAEDFKDHRIILVSLQLEVALKDYVKKKRIPVYEREKMKTPAAKDFIRRSMLQYNDSQIPTASRNADQHLTDLYAYVEETMKDNFVRSSQTERPSWISLMTWENLITLKHVRREVKLMKKSHSQAILRQIFLSWRNSEAPIPSQTWTKNVLMKKAGMDLIVMKLAPFVRRKIAEEEAAYFSSLADAFADRCKEADGTEIWKAIRCALPKYRARVKSRAMNYTSTLEQLEGHFAEIESARAMETDELLNDLHLKAKQAIKVMREVPRNLADLPSLLDFEQALQRNKCGKSVFGDILPEWARACPREMAVQAFPIFMHLFIWAQQPALLKGGRYFPLWKGKNSQTLPTSYRAILINAVLAKCAHHVLRQRLLGPLKNVLIGFQVGGLPKMSVTFASHSLSLRREAAAARKVSHAIIFCDFRSAFYSVRRSLLTDNCLGYSDFWDDEEMAVGAAVEVTPMEEAGVPRALRAVTQEVLNASWYHVPLPGVETKKHWIPSRGSRPGDPIADITFTYLMARILRKVVNDTEKTYPHLETIDGKSLPLLPITWVDDTCFMMEDLDHEQLLCKITKVIQSLKKHSTANGLDLNFDKGKSELLIRFQGKGAWKAHRDFRSQGKGVHFDDEHGNSMRINSTSRYAHLGMIQTAAMNGDAEVNHRLALAGEALRAVRMKILRNENISRKRRFDLAAAVILSRLFYGTEVWTTVSAKHVRKMDAFLYQLHREILGFHSFQENERRSYLQLEAEYPFVDAMTFIRLHRLRYFRKCKLEAPEILILQIWQDDQLREDSWLTFLRQDFAWLQKHLPLPEAPHDPGNVDGWWNLAIEDEARWKRWGLKAAELGAEARQKAAREALCRTMEPDVWDPVWHDTFACVQCGKEFDGRAALTVHQYKIHNVLAPERAYIYDTTCGSCLRCCHTVQRLRQHLRQHPACLSHLTDVWHPRQDVVIGEVAKSSSNSEYRLPYDMVYGPMLPTREAWQEAAPWKRFPDQASDREVEDALLQALDASRSESERQEVLALAGELLALS